MKKSKPVAQARCFNEVQTDFMWRQRCQAEERQLLESFAGPKAHQIEEHMHKSKAQHFYTNQATAKPQVPNPFNTQLKLDAQALSQMPSVSSSHTKQQEKSISSKQTSTQYESMSLSSKAATIRTTQSTRDRLEQAERELQIERAKREEMEAELNQLKQSAKQ